MNEHPRDFQEMAQATADNDLDAVRRILARQPNLAHCLAGYNDIAGDEDFTILKMLLAAGADINDRGFGTTLLHRLVDINRRLSGIAVWRRTRLEPRRSDDRTRSQPTAPRRQGP
jgi:hypothetical protein